MNKVQGSNTRVLRSLSESVLEKHSTCSGILFAKICVHGHKFNIFILLIKSDEML